MLVDVLAPTVAAAGVAATVVVVAVVNAVFGRGVVATVVIHCFRTVEPGRDILQHAHGSTALSYCSYRPK